MQRQSKRIQATRHLLGLALIGFVLWLAASGWLPVATAGAASGGMRHGDPQARLAHLQTELNLTDAQVDQIRPILEAQTAKARELMVRHRGQDRRTLRTEMQALRDETRTALADVVSAEQLAQWEALVDNRRRNFRHGRDR
jgi:Spy/CpxP family protein refolding chaperone